MIERGSFDEPPSTTLLCHYRVRSLSHSTKRRAWGEVKRVSLSCRVPATRDADGLSQEEIRDILEGGFWRSSEPRVTQGPGTGDDSAMSPSLSKFAKHQLEQKGIVPDGAGMEDDVFGYQESPCYVSCFLGLWLQVHRAVGAKRKKSREVSAVESEVENSYDTVSRHLYRIFKSLCCSAVIDMTQRLRSQGKNEQCH